MEVKIGIHPTLNGGGNWRTISLNRKVIGEVEISNAKIVTAGFYGLDDEFIYVNLKENFNITDKLEVAKQIIKKNKIHLLEEKYKKNSEIYFIEKEIKKIDKLKEKNND